MEKQVHRLRDVVFNENPSRARLKCARQNLATLRRWSLNPLKADQLIAKRSLKGCGMEADWDNAYLLHLPGINLDA